jgi:hypothetical protein
VDYFLSQGKAMKRATTLFLLMSILFLDRVVGQGHGNFGSGRSQFGGQHGHGAFGSGRGHFSSNIRPFAAGGVNFRSSHRGALYRHGLYSPGFFFPFYWADGYSEPFIDAELLMPEFLDGERLYYQRAPSPDVEANCKDVWSGNSTTNSVSQTMNRIFEMQCENRHPSPETELRHRAHTPSGVSNPAATPATRD